MHEEFICLCIYVVLEMVPRTSHLVDKHSTKELLPKFLAVYPSHPTALLYHTIITSFTLSSEPHQAFFKMPKNIKVPKAMLWPTESLFLEWNLRICF